MRAAALAVAASMVIPPSLPAAPAFSSRDAVRHAFAKQVAQEQARIAAAKRAKARRLAALRAARARARISRQAVLSRGRAWVNRRIPYSQVRSYRGYRTDCSGFVSMAWNTKRSYTTYTIGAVSRRVGRGSIKPGDAVLYHGHIVLFVRWHNKRSGTFVSYEEANRRSGTIKRVRPWKNGRAMRYRRIAS